MSRLSKEAKSGNSAPPVRVGILSTGFIAERFVASARESTAATIVAVASRTADRAEQAAAAWGVEHAFGSYLELLESDAVEAVYIAVPNSLHLHWTTQALARGKHVLCEKPFDHRADRVEAVFALADQKGLKLSEAFMYRHQPQTRLLSHLVSRGEIGTLQAVRAAFSFVVWAPDSNVRLRRELNGGALMDVGCYCISAARLLAGEPMRAYGEQILGTSGVDERFHGTLRFRNDVVAHIDAGLRSRHADLTVIGSEGTLYLRDPWHCRAPGIILSRPDGSREHVEAGSADSYQLELDDFARAIRGASRPLLGVEDSVGQARAIDALYRSARTGLPVAIYE